MTRGGKLQICKFGSMPRVGLGVFGKLDIPIEFYSVMGR
jgi:hypothetical protein